MSYYNLILSLNDEWVPAGKLKTVSISPQVIPLLEELQKQEDKTPHQIFEKYILQPLYEGLTQNQIHSNSRVTFYVDGDDLKMDIRQQNY